MLVSLQIFGALQFLSWMIVMDQERFLHCYNSIKFQGSDDPFSIARTKRRCLALNFFASIHLHQDNDLTNYLLWKNLESYAETVDDRNPENVNNYAESVLGLIPPNLHVADKNQRWKTNLENVQLEDFVKPLPCTKKFNKDLKCCDSHFEEEEFCQLHEALNQFVEFSEFTEVVKKKDDSASISSDKNFDCKITDSKIKEQDINIDIHSFAGKSANYENEKWKGIAFKTAREELHLQNLKKHGFSSTSNKNEGTYNSVSIKKSLGTRKGVGVFSKFQPPTRQKDNAINENNNSEKGTKQKTSDEEVDERLKHIDPKMVELIKSEIMDCATKITWDDIAGLEFAKTTIQEIVVWPMLRPDIFTGLRRPPKGILLFGPPGTGKTLIGKCIASQSCSTFFSISASSLTSKWIGDGEKMVRALFAVARCQQPAVVFIDEIDSLLSQRSDSEHESTRRLKTEFLVQLDGAGTAEDDRILIIGATNRPQELDEAARRRLVKRLYIPLPECRAREQIIHNLISKERHTLTDAEIREIALLCEGYSGADMKNLCQEASLGPIRSIPPMEIRNVNLDEVRPLNVSDFKSALNRIKSSVSETDLDVYVKWDNQYGCGAFAK